MVAETSEEANVTGGRGRINPLDCAHCGLRCGPSGDDPCIENLPGVMNACCGHGKPECAYIQYSPTSLIRGRAAFERLRELRDIPLAVLEKS